MNLPRRLILDQKVQCLVTTDVILSNRNTYFESVFLVSLIVSPHNFNHLLRPNSKTSQHRFIQAYEQVVIAIA